MYIIIEGEFSDWRAVGYVETEKEALDICATHNAEEDNYCDWWYFEKIEPMAKRDSLQEGFYDYRVVFNPDKEFVDVNKCTVFPTIREKPRIVQEDEYCYVVRVTTIGEEKAMKIAKDFLMQTLAERAGIC